MQELRCIDLKMSDSASQSNQPRSIGLHHGAKSLLRNVIKHTDTHNRLLEESEMWQQFYKMKGTSPGQDDTRKDSRDERKQRERRQSNSNEEERGFRDPDIHKSFLYDERQDMIWNGRSAKRGMKRAHMDDSSGEDGPNSSLSRVNGTAGSTYWMRQLHKAEEADPDRWGHAGFKELYPDAYDSDRSDHQEYKGKKLKRKKRKKKKHRDDLNTSKKHKKKSKKRKKTKKEDSDHGQVSHRATKRKKDRSDDRTEKSHRKRKRSKSKSDRASSADGSEREREPLTRVELSRGGDSDGETTGSDSDSNSPSQTSKRRRNIKTESERQKEADLGSGQTEPSHHARKRRKYK